MSNRDPAATPAPHPGWSPPIPTPALPFGFQHPAVLLLPSRACLGPLRPQGNMSSRNMIAHAPSQHMCEGSLEQHLSPDSFLPFLCLLLHQRYLQ